MSLQHRSHNLIRALPIAAACVVLGQIAPAQAAGGREGYIPISGAQFKPLAIAVEQAQGDAQLAAEFTTTVRDDLALCGLFNVLDPQSFLVDAAKEATVVTQIDFTKWRAIGGDYVAKASIKRVGSTVTAEAWLFESVSPSEMLHTSFPSTDDDVKTLGHRWANAIVKKLSTFDGFFLTRVAYVRAMGNNEKEIWVSDLDGRHAENLTPHGGLNLLPAFSPDGKTIAFTSFREGSPMLYLADFSTHKIHALPKRGSLQTGAAYSPDGKRLAFTMSERGRANIYVMNIDGSNLKALTDTRDTNSSPCWSPDGKRIAFVSTRSGDPQIFAMNSDGSGNPERLTFQGRYNQTPDWSPRGDEITFTARDERNVFDIFSVNVQTKTIKRLTQDSGHNEEPSFSPNGSSVIFTSSRTGRKQVWMMNRDGQNQRKLPIEGETFTPSWGPQP